MCDKLLKPRQSFWITLYTDTNSCIWSTTFDYFMHNRNHYNTLCNVYSYWSGCVIFFIHLTVTDTIIFILFTQYVQLCTKLQIFYRQNRKKKRIVSYIQTNTVYFCFTVPFKVVDDDFQIFRLQIITGPPQLHSSRRSFRKWPRR